jgi:hypothetical protein
MTSQASKGSLAHDYATLELINDRFGSILKDGEIERCPMLPEEKNEPETAHLHRLRLKFNRKDFGLLRSLIDAINADT